MKTGNGSVLAVLVLLLFSTTAFASVNDDQVTSQKIKEADGTSGQDTNSGSGVKTGHIQDGAVTDIKIGGTVSQSKITGLENALAGKSDVTHNHDVLYQQKYGKVAVVAQTGGDYTNPLTAMDDIVTWCGSPSAANPCLLKIMPGVYDLGGSVLETRPYVDIEGTGENVTVIRSTSRVIHCNDNVAVRQLTAESTGGSKATAFFVFGSAKLSNVTAKASGGVVDNIGIEIWSGSPLITNVAIEVFGDARNWGITSSTQGTVTLNGIRITTVNGSANYAIEVISGTLEMNNVTARAYQGVSSRGIWAVGGTVSMRNSYIYGENAGVDAESAVLIQNSTVKGGYSLSNIGSTKVSLSQLDGPVSTSGVLTCFNVYDANFMPLTCP